MTTYAARRERCSIPRCDRDAAPGHAWCHQHVLVACAGARGGYLSDRQADAEVRAGRRAGDVMADEDDWIAR